MACASANATGAVGPSSCTGLTAAPISARASIAIAPTSSIAARMACCPRAATASSPCRTSSMSSNASEPCTNLAAIAPPASPSTAEPTVRITSPASPLTPEPSSADTPACSGRGMRAAMGSTSPRKSGTQQPPPSKEPAISPSTEPSTSSVTAPPAGANTGALITEHLPRGRRSQPGRPAHARRPAPGTHPTRLQRPDRTSPTPRWPRGAEPGPAAVQPGTSPAPAGRAAPCAACGAELSPPVLPPQPAPPAPLIESAPALRSPGPHCVPQCRFAQYRSSKAPLFPLNLP